MGEYKNSNIDWIGNIPSEWDIQPLGIYFDERREKVSDTDFEPLSVTKGGVVKQLDNIAKSDAHDDRKKVCKNDFVINSRSDRKQSCGLSNYDGSVSLINTVLIPNTNKLLPNYVKYLFDNCMFAEEFYRNGHGIVADLWTTNFSDMKRIAIPIPSISEQIKIANTLDMRIPKINRILENLNKQVNILNIYKKSIINNETDGTAHKEDKIYINSTYYKSIPKLWSWSKIKYNTEIFGRIGYRGYTEEDLTFEGEGAITLSPSNIVNGKMNYDNCTYLTWNKYYESPEIMINNNDILFVKTGSTYGKVGFVENLPMEATINPQFVVFKKINNNKLLNKYFYYYLQSNTCQKQIENIVGGSTIPTISQEKILNMEIIIPPISEQEKIIDYLDFKCKEIDSMIKNKNEQIKKLETYKKALIYECVTGKKRVKGE